MYTPKGFKEELRILFVSLDDLVKNTTDSKKQVLVSFSQQIDSFFNCLDYSLYNKERIQNIKEYIYDILPQYVDCVYGIHEEKPKVDESMINLFGCYLISASLIGIGSYMLLSNFVPSLIPVSFFAGFLGGAYITDVLDENLNSKYDTFKKTKKNLERKCLEQIN